MYILVFLYKSAQNNTFQHSTPSKINFLGQTTPYTVSGYGPVHWVITTGR